MIQMDKHKETFREEAHELLGELELSLLELKEFPGNREIIGRVFRAMHTIKGSGAMFGFDDIAGFTHEIETVFDLVRNGKITVTKELINLTLSARDLILEMLDAHNGNNPPNEESIKEIVALFKRLASDTGIENAAPAEGKPVTPVRKEQCEIVQEQIKVTYRIRFHPSNSIFLNGTNPLCLLNELRELGDCSVVPHVDIIPSLEDINPELCYTYWDIILTTQKEMNAIKDVFIFVEEDSRLNIRVVDDSKKLGEILIERGDLKLENLQNALGTQKRIGDILQESGLVANSHIKSALIEQKQVGEVRAKRQEKIQAETASSIRVPAIKLDNFVDLVGELVIIQQRLSQTALGQNNSELLSIAEEVERLTVELRDSAFSVRMLPIGTLFSKFKRLVHDLSNELGREVEMTTDGAETELDKTVIEQLNDPLVHLIRNSIDHGIEPPDVRVAAGKTRSGTIHLSAIHSGSNVLIQIKDDGKGLDAPTIRSKAIKSGLIDADAQLTEKELFALIFLPGFSTAEKVTSVSGRGVGMDVVKRTIETLRGSIDIASVRGAGAAITIKLPLTLAIIEGLHVDVGGEQFVLPLSMVEECVELSRADAEKAHGWRITNVRGELVPYIRLREWFRIEGEAAGIEQIVITRMDNRRVGFVVDNVVGEHQTVIKALGKIYRNIEGISGATILGSGSVALILDVPQLIQGAESVFARNNTQVKNDTHEVHAPCAAA